MAQTALSRDEALRLLREHMPVLVKRFGVSDLALFGSTARDEATADSDVDILVTYESGTREEQNGTSWWGDVGAEDYLSDLFGRRVDLVERRLLRKEYRPWVEADAVDPLDPRPLMSESSRPKRWDIYIQDMLDSCQSVVTYTSGVNRASFLANREKYDATVRNVEIIGEAATKLPEHVREANPEIPWRAVIDARNRLIHGYRDIDDDKLWAIIRQHVPELIKRLTPLLAQAKAELTESGE